jgi:hypothetical protein
MLYIVDIDREVQLFLFDMVITKAITLEPKWDLGMTLTQGTSHGEYRDSLIVGPVARYKSKAGSRLR